MGYSYIIKKKLLHLSLSKCDSKGNNYYMQNLWATTSVK